MVRDEGIARLRLRTRIRVECRFEQVYTEVSRRPPGTASRVGPARTRRYGLVRVRATSRSGYAGSYPGESSNLVLISKTRVCRGERRQASQVGVHWPPGRLCVRQQRRRRSAAAEDKTGQIDFYVPKKR